MGNLNMNRRTYILAILIVTMLAAVADACPMCKESLPATDAQQASAVPVGFNYSVYLLLAGFLGVLSLISGVIYKGVRDANNRGK